MDDRMHYWRKRATLREALKEKKKKKRNGNCWRGGSIYGPCSQAPGCYRQSRNDDCPASPT